MTEFLQHKPWYAGTKHDIDADVNADVDMDVDSNPEGYSASASEAGEETEDADFWIPQATPDGRLFYFNTLTGVSRRELPPKRFGSTDPTSDWETNPMDSSSLPYEDREDTVRSRLILPKLAREDDVGGDTDATLAELEGEPPKSLVGPSEVESWTRRNVERRWQAREAELERKRATRTFLRP